MTKKDYTNYNGTNSDSRYYKYRHSNSVNYSVDHFNYLDLHGNTTSKHDLESASDHPLIRILDLICTLFCNIYNKFLDLDIYLELKIIAKRRLKKWG